MLGNLVMMSFVDRRSTYSYLRTFWNDGMGSFEIVFCDESSHVSVL